MFMSADDILKEVAQSVVDLNSDACKAACIKALENGISPMEIISGGLAAGMTAVGEKYVSKEFFLPELIVSGDVVQESMEVLKPHLKAADANPRGKIVVGTVKGDLHDIGKNIFAMLLKAAGFDVIDLGANVPAEAFVKAVRESDAKILGMSALLSTSMTQMEDVVKELARDGLRRQVRIIVGGAPITPEYAEKIGADYGAHDAVDGVDVCKSWLSVE
jgi:5-methyltetrahydrofolate--homocysteine methyltransferase